MLTLIETTALNPQTKRFKERPMTLFEINERSSYRTEMNLHDAAAHAVSTRIETICITLRYNFETDAHSTDGSARAYSD
jgi:hypothetical protein